MPSFFRRKPRPETPPEWLIVGLGNPGPEYRNTRHNVGFEVVERLGGANGIRLSKGQGRALTGMGAIGGVPVLLAKPLTFMNASGQAVAWLARRYGLKPERVLVVADDMDLRVGRTRLKAQGSSGGHNGHKSIIESLGSQDYPRLKIGIGSPSSSGIDHVLSTFDREEREAIEDALVAAVAGCEAVVQEGVERAMNRVNLPRGAGEELAEE